MSKRVTLTLNLTEAQAELLGSVVAQAAMDCADPARGRRLEALSDALYRARMVPPMSKPRGMEVWFVRHVSQPNLHWNNETGWSRGAPVTVFSKAERETLSLPMDGIWVCGEISTTAA